jgi:hypothetical protein
MNFADLTPEEQQIIINIFKEVQPQRDKIIAARSANPDKWFDYQAQSKALDQQVRARYEQAIADYRAPKQSPASNAQSSSTQGFLNDYLAALPGGEQGPAQGPNTPVRRDGDLFVPKDFAPPPYREVPLSSGPRGENLGEIAAEYKSAPKEPDWMRQIREQMPPGKGFTGPYDQFGRPTGVGGSGAKQATEDVESTDYSIATVLSGSDQQRQGQTAQAEFDPQKAKTATAAAKSYKQSGATEDPFRSQAVFG